MSDERIAELRRLSKGIHNAGRHNMSLKLHEADQLLDAAEACRKITELYGSRTGHLIGNAPCWYVQIYFETEDQARALDELLSPITQPEPKP